MLLLMITALISNIFPENSRKGINHIPSSRSTKQVFSGSELIVPSKCKHIKNKTKIKQFALLVPSSYIRLRKGQ